MHSDAGLKYGRATVDEPQPGDDTEGHGIRFGGRATDESTNESTDEAEGHMGRAGR